MSGVTHVAVGALIGQTAGQPVIGFAGGVLSHLIVDLIPHQELFDWRTETVSSVLLALVLIGLAPQKWLIGAGIAGATLPDVEILLWLSGVLRRDQLTFPSHRIRQPESERFIFKAFQIGVFAFSLFWLPGIL